MVVFGPAAATAGRAACVAFATLPEIMGAVAGVFQAVTADVDGDGGLDALSSNNDSDSVVWDENWSTRIFACGFETDSDPLAANLGCWSAQVP